MEDNVSWLPHYNDSFCIWKHLLNHIWVTEAWNRPKKRPNMVLICDAVYYPLSNIIICWNITFIYQMVNKPKQTLHTWWHKCANQQYFKNPSCIGKNKETVPLNKKAVCTAKLTGTENKWGSDEDKTTNVFRTDWTHLLNFF